MNVWKDGISVPFSLYVRLSLHLFQEISADHSSALSSETLCKYRYKPCLSPQHCSDPPEFKGSLSSLA